MPIGIGLHSIVHSVAKRRGVRQFTKFAIVGLSGTILNFVLFTILQRLVPNHDQALQYAIIYSIAFMAGGVSNYYLNRRWTFRSDANAVREGVQFLTVSALALLVGLAVAPLTKPFFGNHYGHRTWLVGTIAGIFVNFFVNKYWTFRHTR